MLLQVAVQDIGQLPYFEQNRRSFFLRYAAICAADVTPSVTVTDGLAPGRVVGTKIASGGALRGSRDPLPGPAPGVCVTVHAAGTGGAPDHHGPSAPRYSGRVASQVTSVEVSV
jgi:hypothetical protein